MSKLKLVVALAIISLSQCSSSPVIPETIVDVVIQNSSSGSVGVCAWDHDNGNACIDCYMIDAGKSDTFKITEGKNVVLEYDCMYVSYLFPINNDTIIIW